MGFWDDKKPPKEDFVTKDDVRKMREDIGRLEKNTEMFTGKDRTGQKVIKAIRIGFGNIAQSLNEPDSKRRPRIARMQSKKPPIANFRIQTPIAGRNAGIKRRKISNAPD